MTDRQLHLNVNALPAGAHPAAWRSPGGNPRAWIDIGHYQRVAREAERGLLDAVFLADGLLLRGNVATGPSFALDPVVLVAAMAVATERIGFIATVSTTFHTPYHIARVFSSLDHASGGRVGWNVVTTRDPGAAENHGLTDLPTRAERYARAAETVEVANRLWDSWEDGAFVGDPQTRVFARTDRIHRVDHRGAYHAVRGPLQLPRSPQGRPVLVQAGGSDTGRDLAARYADAVFSPQHLLGSAQAYYADIKSRARAHGRDPDTIRVLPGLNPIVGSTEAEARRRQRELNELVDDDQLLAGFAARFGFDPADLHLDRPFPAGLLRATGDTYGSQGFDDAARALLSADGLTLREIIHQGVIAHRVVVGAPEQIADTIEEWFVQRGADGFNLQCDVYPGGLTDFVDHVVPELQRRGLFRKEYTGTTLRDHLGLARPASSYPAGWVR
ncbi:LLM class flavin-dependent oxidoreductase [Micromonospora sp. CPCC 206060]|uniref:LLM class flavin-dependent oxidoreductase n=1 Tax=Micromonospora sp. CPCC 206060 TaxID=3122406 RepID=UPI002FEF915D